MSEASTPAAEPPWVTFYRRLLAHADDLDARGGDADAAALRALATVWWSEQEEWRARMFETLRVHHEINNALVGIRGNAQLLMMGPAAQVPGVKDRLEVMLRETRRIQEAGLKLRELKTTLGGASPLERAA